MYESIKKHKGKGSTYTIYTEKSEPSAARIRVP